MTNYRYVHCEFEAEQIKRTFFEGDFESLKADGNKINDLMQKYEEMSQNHKERIQELKTINKIVNGKLLIGL